MTKTFRVASVSENTNSFGLTGMYLMTRSGETWEVGANHLNVKMQGAMVMVSCSEDGLPDWVSKGYEIPHRLPQDAPPKVVAAIFA